MCTRAARNLGADDGGGVEGRRRKEAGRGRRVEDWICDDNNGKQISPLRSGEECGCEQKGESDSFSHHRCARLRSGEEEERVRDIVTVKAGKSAASFESASLI